MAIDIVDKLIRFNSGLNEAEQANFKLLLGLAAGGLAPDFERPSDQSSAKSFDTVSNTLARLQPYSSRLTDGGVAYRGRPSFLTEQLLTDLQGEARALRPQAIRSAEHFLGYGAPIANRLAISMELLQHVREYAGDVESTGIASFLYYDEEGQGIEPHIDTDIFSLNVLLMLHHEHQIEPTSSLVIFPPGEQARRYRLVPGEMLILFAGSIAHGRERMKQGESVGILTFGFKPISA